MRDEPLKEAESSEAATSRIELELLQTETCRAEFAVSRKVGGRA